MRDAPTRAVVISTHAPRTGSDTQKQAEKANGWDFNPRSPHGERRVAVPGAGSAVRKFQPTLPARGATIIG